MNKKYLVLLFIATSLGTIYSCNNPSENEQQEISIKVFSGPEAKIYLDDIARIRITLFREYPYLYEGNVDTEKIYLETYFKSEQSNILLAFNKNELVGFSNSIPLSLETDEIQNPFKQKKLDCQEYLYIGEVMIYPNYRNKGILKNFLEYHAKRARDEGYLYTTGMTVDRPDNHPLKPANYKGYDLIWKYFGYAKVPNLSVNMSWKQVDTNQEVPNTLSIWVKQIS